MGTARPAVLLLTAAAAAEAVKDQTPKFKWSQSMKEIKLALAVKCRAEGKEARFGRDEFSLTCAGEDGARYALTLELREDLADEGSSCAPGAKGEETCVLAKRDDHPWDALTTRADQKRLKGLMQKDWRGEFVKKEDIELEDDDEGEDWFEGSPIKPLKSVKAFSKWMADTEFGIIDPSLPWCTKCKAAKEKLVGIARTMKKEAKFAYVDAREIREARRIFKPECDYTCIFYVTRKGEAPYKVKHEYEEEKFLASLRAFAAPLLSTLASDADVARFRKKYTTSVVATARPGDDATAGTVRAAAAATRGQGALAWALRESAEAPAGGGATLYKPAEDKESTFTGPVDIDALLRWVNLTKVPLLQKYDWEIRDPIAALGLPHAELFVDEKAGDDESGAAVAAAKGAARALLGEVVFVTVDKEMNSYMAEDFGFDKDAGWPRLGLATGFDADDTKRYAYDADGWDADAIAQWCRTAAAGKVRRTFKTTSVADATDREAGEVRVVVGGTLPHVTEAAETTLIVFHKSWSEDSDALQKSLKKAARALAKYPAIGIARMDTGDNHFDKAQFHNTDSWHSESLGFLVGEGFEKTVKYAPKKWTPEGLFKFLQKNTDLHVDWLQVDAALAEANAEEAREKAAEAARLKAKMEEEMNKLKELESVNVTDDGLVKFVRKAGYSVPAPDGPVKRPGFGAKVKAHYHGTLLSDGSMFDSSKERDEPFEFSLGKREVIKCWDMGFATMAIGEEATLICPAEYAYGDNGSPPKIPAKAALRFDVELLSFEGKSSEDALSEAEQKEQKDIEEGGGPATPPMPPGDNMGADGDMGGGMGSMGGMGGMGGFGGDDGEL